MSFSFYPSSFPGGGFQSYTHPQPYFQNYTGSYSPYPYGMYGGNLQHPSSYNGALDCRQVQMYGGQPTYSYSGSCSGAYNGAYTGSYSDMYGYGLQPYIHNPYYGVPYGAYDMYGGGYGGLCFDPRMFMLPNAIYGYGVSTGAVQFPGITFDQGQTLRKRLETSKSQQRGSLYHSVPDNEILSGASAALREGLLGFEDRALYSSADATSSAFARPASIAPGSPPPQFASPTEEKKGMAASLLASFMPTTTKSASSRPHAASVPAKAGSLQPTLPKAGSLQPAKAGSLQPTAKGGSLGPSPVKPVTISGVHPKPDFRVGAGAMASAPPGQKAEAVSIQGKARSSSVTPTAGPVLCGVGLLFSREKLDGSQYGWIVRKVVEGSPAGKAGSIKLGDELISVDSQPMSACSDMMAVSKHLLGPEGQASTLVFNNASDGVYSVRLRRSNTFAGAEGSSNTGSGGDVEL